MNLRALALASLVALPFGSVVSLNAPLEGVRPASATVALLVSLERMVSQSAFVVVGTAGERHCVWEDSVAGRHIVTYTKVTVERAVVGSPGAEIWVRTLGGEVGEIGQSVSGEAQIVAGARALLFLAKADEAFVVTAMSQGHYRVVTDNKTKVLKLASSPDTGALLPRPGQTTSARERLLGTSLEDAVASIQKAKRSVDAQK
jgi:hypothetical protein